jgi:hypothetical protein
MAAMLTAAENRVLPISKKKQKQDKKNFQDHKATPGVS